MTTALTYEYRARDKSGAIHAGQMEGSSPSAVAGTLREKGYIPLRIDERKAMSLQKEIQIPGFKKKVKTKDVAIFSRQLATMVNSGLTLIRALTILDELADRLPAVAEKLDNGLWTVRAEDVLINSCSKK